MGAPKIKGRRLGSGAWEPANFEASLLRNQSKRSWYTLERQRLVIVIGAIADANFLYSVLESYFCLSVSRLSVCLLVCRLFVCLSVWLFVSVESVCVSWLFVCLSVCLIVCLFVQGGWIQVDFCCSRCCGSAIIYSSTPRPILYICKYAVVASLFVSTVQNRSFFFYSDL